MNRHRRLLLFLVIAVFVGLVVRLGTDHFTREPPNYSQIEDGLWLGGFVPEPPRGTAATLNVCETEDPYQTAFHRWEPIRDAEPAPTIEWLRNQVQFIADNRSAGRIVFVHCRNGVSRSAMVTAAYLMNRDQLTRDQALEKLRVMRPGVRPNPAFMKLLTEWERAK